MSKGYQEELPKSLRNTGPAQETVRARVCEVPAEETRWESENREILAEMSKELETEHDLSPEAIVRVLHIREDFLQMILKDVGNGGGDK